MKKLFMPLITTILITPLTTHAACTATPDCATLGYTKTSADCPDGAIKCPFDTSKLFCTPKAEQRCAVGDILYSDKTCDPTKISGKTPIGIVGYINGTKRMAVSINTVSLPWGPGYPNDAHVPGVTAGNYLNTNAIMNDFNGKSNTAAWVAYYGADSNYAPGYCYNYTTTGTNKGDWYLPGCGEAYVALQEHVSIVETAAKRAGSTNVNPGQSYWSSTQDNNGGNTNSAWVVFQYGKTGYMPYVNVTMRTNKIQTRCAIDF